MSEESDGYFNDVQQYLDKIGQSVVLTADERDIVDDYEAQQFHAKVCAERIEKARTYGR